MAMREKITTVRQEMMTAASIAIFMVTNTMMTMTVSTGVPTMVIVMAGSTSTVKTFRWRVGEIGGGDTSGGGDGFYWHIGVGFGGGDNTIGGGAAGSSEDC